MPIAIGQRDVRREHFGRCICGRAEPRDPRLLCERWVGLAAEQCRAAEVHEAQIERASMQLLVGGRAVGAQHDIARRNVAMHEACVELSGALELLKHGDAQVGNDSEGKWLVGFALRSFANSVAQGRALHPFHYEQGVAICKPEPIERREAAQVRDRQMDAVFLVECGYVPFRDIVGCGSAIRRGAAVERGPELLSLGAVGSVARCRSA